MLLESTNSPLPTFVPETLYSFYPYPQTSLRTTHETLRTAGPGPSSLLNQERRQRAQERERISKRALMGRRPAGTGGGREAEELSDEEKNLDEDKDGINKFGYRFLLPYGRRFTHMEIDQGPDNNQSPSPSEPDQERRQEDRNIGTPTSPLVGGNGNAEVEDGASPAEEVDLDADIEDMDATFDSEQDLSMASNVEEEGVEPEGDSMEQE